jgi:hypothetical protein
MTMNAKKTAKKSQTYVDLLKEDHRKVKALFKKFENAEETEERRRIVEEAVQELKIHAQLEEEIVYPALSRVLDDEKLVPEAEEEHNIAKTLIAEIEKLDPEDEKYCAKFTVLGEYVDHHIEEEESEMLNRAKDTDVEELTNRLIERKEELMSEHAASK